MKIVMFFLICRESVLCLFGNSKHFTRIRKESHTELEKENKCSRADLLYYDDKFTFETSA